VKRVALITGVGGQDGSYLAEFLLDREYDVWGVTRRGPDAYPNLDRVRDDITFVDADLLDQASLERALRSSSAGEVYNLASISFVPSSWDEPARTAELAAVGVTTLLEAIRGVDPTIRFYQASSSEIFGEPVETPQSEESPLSPLTPYGVAKAYGHFITRSYRHRYGIHASSGILYNHESPRRPDDFLPRKVSSAVARIARGLQTELLLGDLDARRDWGYACDAVRAMWLMLQQDKPNDYVIATGVGRRVGDLVEVAFEHVGLDWRNHVRIDEQFLRGSAELHDLVGDSTRARDVLGWRPSTTFDQLVKLLVDADLDLIDTDRPSEGLTERRVG
jgi:GDPmannose 4,6-dehydratase